MVVPVDVSDIGDGIPDGVEFRLFADDLMTCSEISDSLEDSSASTLRTEILRGP